MNWKMRDYGLGFEMDYALDFALRLLAGCFCFLFLSSFISSYLISFHFLASPMSCPVPLGHELDQYLSVDQWQKKSKIERIKEKGGRWGRIKRKAGKHECLNQLPSNVITGSISN